MRAFGMGGNYRFIIVCVHQLQKLMFEARGNEYGVVITCMYSPKKN